MPRKRAYFEDDPLWYKDAIIYELHVKTFFDSNNDGIGDFKGLTQKLDYLKDLGVTAIWILPFYPSPLKDDGYDIADYYNVNPHYGMLRDFREFLREAHRRSIRVITELVLNHTSDQHQWFQKSRRAKKGSAMRNYYVWNDNPEKYQDARIIFKDFEPSNWSWDPVAKQYFWHRFYSHQPDLNFESPSLQRSVMKVLDFWFEMGIDGVRLDAIPYLYEQEGTNCENLPATYEFLRKLRKYLDGRFKNKMFLAEANQWPEDAVAYFGEGDICHMAFHFPLMPRMFMAIQMADRFPVIDILDQTPPIHDDCQWATFLRNHDELTLEMVTDEERDYMYGIYAKDAVARINLGIRRRLAPLLGNNRRKIELMNVLLFTLPGTPVIYYGDEIGMGDNYYLGDRDGVRTPMQWSADRNAGFSQVNPQKLYLPVIIDPGYHYEAVNVETQQTSSASLLWWMKHTIAIRKRFRAFSRGSLEFLTPENSKILSFIRQYENETLLVATNLSKYAQTAELDLTKYSGRFPEEVLSHNRFPVITDHPYMLTFTPHSYYIFELKEETGPADTGSVGELRVSGNWTGIFEEKALERLERYILPRYLQGQRWYGSKSRTIRRIRVEDIIPFNGGAVESHILMVKVKYSEGLPEVYVIPLSFACHGSAGRTAEELKSMTAVRDDDDHLCLSMEKLHQECPQAIIARLVIDGEEGVLFDSFYNPVFRDRIIDVTGRRKRLRGRTGDIFSYPGRQFRKIIGERSLPLESVVLKAEQSNTSLLYDNAFFFKLYRKTSEGMNPDMEIIRFLTEKTKFASIPSFAGALEYRVKGQDPCILGMLQEYVPNQGDTWTYSLDAVKGYYDRILSKRHAISAEELEISIFDFDSTDIAPQVQELIGGVFIEFCRLLGKRTGELHLALSSVDTDPAFSPESFSVLYQRSLYQSLRSLTRKVFQPLGKNLKKLPENLREEAEQIYQSEKTVLKYYEKILKRKIPVTKTRIHGDYHLGQVLHTGKDVIILDFEGEPARSLSERKIKRSPLVDVAGMLRSFHYAVHVEYFNHIALRPEDSGELQPWIDPWFRSAGKVFLHSYLDTAGNADFIPKEARDLEILLNVFLLEKAVYEVGYELNNRPDWLLVPFRGIRSILGLSE
ncbi:MAG: alpha-amylase [Nitrospira bacterium SG8_35_1]|nr:MAG: alpha-amylase [Nitrospira bacterium SG8_35_1]